MKKDTVKMESGQEGGPANPIDNIAEIAQEIANLNTGLVSELRRGPLAKTGSVAYWRLLAQFEIPSSRERQRVDWADVFQSIAILTPKGRPQGAKLKQSAHDPRYPMGSVMRTADISEERLARLLASPQEIRGSMVIRLCRRLSAAGHNRFNLKTLAAFILGRESASQRIAKEYYRANANAPASKQTRT